MFFVMRADLREQLAFVYKNDKWYNIFFNERERGRDTSMTIDRKVSSIESSFKMESMPFDTECRKRVRDILIKKVSVEDAIAELNRKYCVSAQKNERSGV